ncbi:MAG: NAD(+)/NADH kinase [Candidatus Melainabacteria bacterium]|jgi:NAD+ kinase|nr:NAD(+)/NADH kinase [Candidatus Melainabacteria bacterium]
MIKEIAIFFNPLKAQAPAFARALAIELEAKSLTCLVIEAQANNSNWSELKKSTDLAVVMGGDGTFLCVSKQVIKHQIPLLGINFGHLGFLSEYGDMEVKELADAIANNDLVIQERSLLQAEVPSLGKKVIALNEVVVSRDSKSNLLYTDLYIDDDLLHSFRSDGIIVSTPTGSTAYALSAGGAVMDPNIKAFEIVPIAAHSLASRAHVISDEQCIVLETKDNKTNFFMQADGQDLIELEPGSRIVFSKAEYSLKLAQLKASYRSFYSILRDKMKWGEIGANK